MILRRSYLEQLERWKDKKIIKVVTGVRRCGKSTLLAEFQTKLLQGGVDIGQIISLNFEDLYYEDLLDYRKLYNFLQKKIITGKPTYIFLDKTHKGIPI